MKVVTFADVGQSERAIPRLTRSDAYLLAALTESGGRGVDLPSLLHDYDWLNRDIPTFDELSFGIPRLVAHGYAEVGRNNRGELRFRATRSAHALRRSIDARARTIGDVVIAMATIVGTAPYPEPEVEDRALGRLDELRQDDLDLARQKYGAWMARWSRPLIAMARLVGWWVNRRAR